MARKYNVIEPDGSKSRQLKKSVALLLVRRQVAKHHPSQPYTIIKLALHLQPSSLLRPESPQTRRKACLSYEHHIEPRFIKFAACEQEVAESYALRGW